MLDPTLQHGNEHPMNAKLPNPENLSTWIKHQLDTYPLFDALRGRRSRRFGAGMTIPEGPFAYTSSLPPQPLSDEEEAALAFAATGITGYALADLSYGRGQGGRMLDGLIGRTIASADAINTVSLVVINDNATYLLKRPQDLAPSEIAEFVELSRAGAYTDIYKRLRVKIRDGRTTIPVVPGLNFNINKWSLYADGTTYYLPINDMTAMYINALLEIFDPTMGLWVIDERNFFQPAGIGKFGKNRGGHLANHDPQKTLTLQGLEMSLAEAIAVEQGMMLHSLGLAGQAIGLGGFPNYARNEYAWLQALGFRLESMPASRYVGAPRILGFLLSLIGDNPPYPYAVGINDPNGVPLLASFTPPNYPSMEAAVHHFVELKFGKQGIFRGEADTVSAWKDPRKDEQKIAPPTQSAIDATVAYCDYVFKRYGRFPAYSAPFRTVIGYQASHVDVAFYERFYKPEALTDTQRERA
jgi:hypothetical protein